MKFITRHSVSRAADEAIVLWALASAHYPKVHTPILDLATIRVIKAVSSFALNARRAMEVLPAQQTYQLVQPRWRWKPGKHGELVKDLREACNRIVHAQELQVGFEELPQEDSFIVGGSLIVPYVRVATDRKKLAFIDPFALAHAFLYSAFPELQRLRLARPDRPPQ